MARAKTKTDLITSANGQFDKMWKLIESISEEQQTATFADEMTTSGKEAHWGRDKNLRDVLVHLYEWHQLLLNWVQANSNGEHKPFLPEPYNWKTYPIKMCIRDSHKTKKLWQMIRSTIVEYNGCA